MADDVKLQLGIDMDALRRDASQATSILSKTFEQQGLGANLLGSGVAATQLPVPQGGKDTLRGVIDALARIDRTLTIGFTSIAGGIYVGGGTASGGGGWGPQGSRAGESAPASGPPRRSIAGGFGSAISRGGDLAQALMPSAMNMFMGGFYGTDVMGFAHNLVSQIPVAGRLLGAITGPFHETLQKNDEFKNTQYELFRDAGQGAMTAFTDLWADDSMRDQYTKKYGFSRAETERLTRSGYRQGLSFGGQGMNSVLDMQGQLGLGEESAQLGGAMRRAGIAKGQEGEVFATMIGTAVSTGLERGRWGEMLTMWQRAAQSSVDTDIAWKQIAAQQQLIGGLGERFKGDTAASQSMDQALRSAASNMGSPLALMTAMRLSGGDYFVATARMARAAQQPDTEMEEGVIDRLMSTPGVRRWLAMPDGPQADAALDNIAGVASSYGTGLDPLKIQTLLKAKKKTTGGRLFGGPSSTATDVGRLVVTGGAPLPTIALGPRRAETEKQRPSDLSAIQDGPLIKGGFGGLLKRNETAQADRELYAGMTRSAPPPPSAFGSSAPGTGDRFGGFGAQPMAVLPDTRGSGGAPAASASSYRQFVMQDFGHQIPGRAPHPGVDLALPPGTPVTAPVDGVIEAINRQGAGMEVGASIHIRSTDDGVLWKLYHIDPTTFPAGLRVGQRIVKGTALGRTYSNKFWKGPDGQQVRTHLHVGQMNPAGTLLDPMRPGGIPPGSLTGPAPSASSSSSPMAGGGGGASIAHVTADVHVHVTQDNFGHPIVRVNAPTPTVNSSPGQLVGGHR